MTETTRRLSIGTITACIVIFFAVLAAFRFLWFARSILVVTFLGILFGLALTAGVDALERRGVRRAIGAVFLTLAVLGTLVGIGALIAPTLRRQATELKETLPKSLDQIDRWMGRKGQELAQTVAPETAGQSKAPDTSQSQTSTAAQQQSGEEPPKEPPQSARPSEQKAAQTEKKASQTLREQMVEPLRSIGKVLFPFISGTFAVVTAIILIIFIALYIATEPDLYRRGLLHLVPLARRPRFDEMFDEMEDSLRRWLIARLLAMLAIGGLTTVVLLLLKVRAAVALGVLAGILEFIPFFGPIVSAIPAIGIALLDSPQKAIWVTLAFVGIQQIEGNVITPILLKKRVHIPPVLTIVAVTSLATVMGVAGMLIAEPLVVVVMIVVKRLYVEDALGDKLESSG